MSIKTINTVVIFKNKTQEEWGKITTFIPQEGEIIIYNIDEKNHFPRLKIGDGITNVNNLPFFQGILPNITSIDDGKFLQISDGEIIPVEANKIEIEVKNETIFFKIS